MTALQARGRSGTSFVSTVRPTHSQRQVALWAAGMSLAVFALVAPFAKMPLAEHPGFLPVYQSALVVFDLVTCVLLIGQYRMVRNGALLLLAAGYAFNALMATAYALSVPGFFAPAWLYFLWHAGFALFILAYACTSRRAAASRDAPSTARGVLALLVLARRRPYTVLDLWLMVVLGAWIADTALAAVLNHARFDVGWYVGRAYGLLANGFVLAVLLLESGSLYARLVRSNRLLGEALSETRRLNDDLQAFAGSLAHDLQQPLFTITAFAQVMRAGELTQRDIAHLDKIAGAADAERRMIKALLEFARLGESPLETAAVDLNVTVGQARDEVAVAAAGREIEWKIETLPTVRGDRALLLLAFVNLLSNAVKYTREQQRAVIRVDAATDGAGAHSIRVSDNGVGFDMSQASRLFAPFQRLHAAREFEGTGMGLANVRRIAERHGGAIYAQSQAGEGAEFTLVLPDAAAAFSVPFSAGAPQERANPGIAG